jgi:hypothetical protein
MVTLIRVGRVLLILVLAVLTVQCIIGIGTAETGVLEKVVLGGLIALCVVLAARVTTVAERWQQRLRS